MAEKGWTVEEEKKLPPREKARKNPINYEQRRCRSGEKAMLSRVGRVLGEKNYRVGHKCWRGPDEREAARGLLGGEDWGNQ